MQTWIKIKDIHGINQYINLDRISRIHVKSQENGIFIKMWDGSKEICTNYSKEKLEQIHLILNPHLIE